jgi:thioredoxin-related protein
MAQKKWLLINVQNVQEFECQALNRDVWSNSGAKAVIKDHFLFWQVYTGSID